MIETNDLENMVIEEGKEDAKAKWKRKRKHISIEWQYYELVVKNDKSHYKCKKCGSLFFFLIVNMQLVI